MSSSEIGEIPIRQVGSNAKQDTRICWTKLVHEQNIHLEEREKKRLHNLEIGVRRRLISETVVFGSSWYRMRGAFAGSPARSRRTGSNDINTSSAANSTWPQNVIDQEIGSKYLRKNRRLSATGSCCSVIGGDPIRPKFGEFGRCASSVKVALAEQLQVCESLSALHWMKNPRELVSGGWKIISIFQGRQRIIVPPPHI
ncbi:hypothetical protein T265_10357 [Opisthorchis viverrini]|uniref:Uncharacterized protein n=1 Tax=Opisthorchis viverrini TaxID=6198 RepID=A0A074Z6V5_OPIVI|nr:hypothetical protein T265_10357 [Opisthorchis viverrini]KER21297.1 hypothetical protein T265_10357 [Opisthorchis viverrini]